MEGGQISALFVRGSTAGVSIGIELSLRRHGQRTEEDEVSPRQRTGAVRCGAPGRKLRVRRLRSASRRAARPGRRRLCRWCPAASSGLRQDSLFEIQAVRESGAPPSGGVTALPDVRAAARAAAFGWLHERWQGLRARRGTRVEERERSRVATPEVDLAGSSAGGHRGVRCRGPGRPGGALRSSTPRGGADDAPLRRPGGLEIASARRLVTHDLGRSTEVLRRRGRLHSATWSPRRGCSHPRQDRLGWNGCDGFLSSIWVPKARQELLGARARLPIGLHR